MDLAVPGRRLSFLRLALFCSLGVQFLATSAYAEPAAEPSPELSPEQVVRIQLEALADNDDPSQDAGIEQVWAFAHPNNREMTGPLERFTRMIKGRNYRTLINHRSYALQRVALTDAVAVYAVRVLAADGSFYGFSWHLRTAEISAGEVWMTTIVSPAEDTGEQISQLERSNLGIVAQAD